MTKLRVPPTGECISGAPNFRGIAHIQDSLDVHFSSIHPGPFIQSHARAPIEGYRRALSLLTVRESTYPGEQSRVRALVEEPRDAYIWRHMHKSPLIPRAIMFVRPLEYRQVPIFGNPHASKCVPRTVIFSGEFANISTPGERGAMPCPSNGAIFTGKIQHQNTTYLRALFFWRLNKSLQPRGFCTQNRARSGAFNGDGRISAISSSRNHQGNPRD